MILKKRPKDNKIQFDRFMYYFDSLNAHQSSIPMMTAVINHQYQATSTSFGKFLISNS